MAEAQTKMGKVVEPIEVWNDQDEGLARAGHLAPNQVRRASLEALVDTGANMLVLPEDIIEKLGLPAVRKVKTRFGDGHVVERTIYGSAKLRVLNREVTVDVLSAPIGVPALLGQIPLEGLDFVVDLKNQRLIPNPAAPDPEMALVECYCDSLQSAGKNSP